MYYNFYYIKMIIDLIIIIIFRNTERYSDIFERWGIDSSTLPVMMLSDPTRVCINMINLFYLNI